MPAQLSGQKRLWSNILNVWRFYLIFLQWFYSDLCGLENVSSIQAFIVMPQVLLSVWFSPVFSAWALGHNWSDVAAAAAAHGLIFPRPIPSIFLLGGPGWSLVHCLPLSENSVRLAVPLTFSIRLVPRSLTASDDGSGCGISPHFAPCTWTSSGSKAASFRCLPHPSGTPAVTEPGGSARVLITVTTSFPPSSFSWINASQFLFCFPLVQRGKNVFWICWFFAFCCL